jgi:hypothetical protein
MYVQENKACEDTQSAIIMTEHNVNVSEVEYRTCTCRKELSLDL